MAQPGTRAHVLILSAFTFAVVASLSAVAFYGLVWLLEPYASMVLWQVTGKTMPFFVLLSWPVMAIMVPIAAGVMAVVWVLRVPK